MGPGETSQSPFSIVESVASGEMINAPGEGSWLIS